MLRPLDFIPSIKLKFGIVIVATVIGTVACLALGQRLGFSLEVRVLSACAIGLLLVQLLARGMTSPLRDMASAASAMARGDYGRRVQATSRDEVGDLARAFNAMAGELGEVERMRRDLVANVSHELRTPIGALQLLLENLVDGIEPNDPATLQTALAQTERLGRLVTQLLDLSKLESGGVPMRHDEFALGPLLDQATRECQLADETGVHVRWRAEPANIVVNGDAERLHQVFSNLLDNAIRHSPVGGKISLAARAGHEGGTTIEVRDEGPGIPPDELERVFERFYRTDHARASSDGGTGLGLAIARWIVDAHGGTIHAAEGDPAGCRIVVQLP